MLHKTKGSILIMSVIVFSIVSIICITCSGLILSNNRIYKLEYYNEVLKQGNLGMIELVNSNILKEISNAMSTSNSEDEFYNYFINNNSNNFINKINNISDSNIKNGEVTVYPDIKESNKEFIRYKIISKYKINNHDKYIRVSFKIKNPFYGKVDDKRENNNLEIEKYIVNLDDLEIKENENHDIDKDDEAIKEDTIINESDLVIFYNYEEM